MAVGPGSDVSKVQNDISQTITLADTIVTLIREPVSLLYQSAVKAKLLKRSLGAWQEEALDGNARCRFPVLRLKELENYLVGLDGVIPGAPQKSLSPSCEDGESIKPFWSLTAWQKQNQALPTIGTACWVYLLFALGICPGMNVVGWRPLADGIITTQNGAMAMEVEGSALCHIINLYSVTIGDGYRGSSKELPDRRTKKECDFSFGKLAWTTINDHVHAFFTPGLESELTSTKLPFEIPQRRRRCLSPNTIMASYLLSLEHGASDSKYHLANADAPLSERINTLLTCFERLSSRENTDTDLLLISYEWFEEAARVKRRVLAQGGEDHSFFEDVCRHERLSHDNGMAYIAAGHHFLLGRETFSFFVRGKRAESMPYNLHELYRAIEETLASYENQPDGSWKRSLFDMRHDVLEVAKIPNKIIIEELWNLQLVEFTASCDLWRQKVLLGAPVGTSCGTCS